MKNTLLYILPTYGQFPYARKCLASLVKNTTQDTYAVALVDDNSPDWSEQDFTKWPACPLMLEHFPTSSGLTRSWNHGLRLARDLKFEYAVCGNSDLLFTKGWFDPLKAALRNFDLVGPVTNAPGHTPWQNVNLFRPFNLTDDPVVLDRTADALRKMPPVIHAIRINGFCLVAKTETWWANAYDDMNVFNPIYKLVGNEDELEKRWLAKKLSIGYVPRSFVFHYRSVSRPAALELDTSNGAFRCKF